MTIRFILHQRDYLSAGRPRLKRREVKKVTTPARERRGIMGIITTKEAVAEYRKAGFSREEMRALNKHAVEMRRLAGEDLILGSLAERNIALTRQNALLEKQFQQRRYIQASDEVLKMITRMS